MMPSAPAEYKSLIDFIAKKRPHNVFSFDHGLSHWSRVYTRGMKICDAMPGVDRSVVGHFAFLHDIMRENEGVDPQHGPRAAEFIKEHREHINLNDVQIAQLRRACSGHTFAMPKDKGTPRSDTLGACWDADRLDLLRVGIVPDAAYMFTKEGRKACGVSSAGLNPDIIIIDDFMLERDDL